MSDFKRTLLETLALMHAEQVAQRSLLEQLKIVCVDTADEVGTQRSRLIEQASRHGVEIHEHEKALIKQDVRLTKIERHLEIEFEQPVVESD